MESSDNVGDREDHSNSNGNEEQYSGPVLETHWTEAGHQRLDKSEMLLYSIHEGENAIHNQ